MTLPLQAMVDLQFSGCVARPTVDSVSVFHSFPQDQVAVYINYKPSIVGNDPLFFFAPFSSKSIQQHPSLHLSKYGFSLIELGIQNGAHERHK